MQNTKKNRSKTNPPNHQKSIENIIKTISTKIYEKLTSQGPLGRQMAPTGAALGSQTVNKSTSVASAARPRPAHGASWTTTSSFHEFWDPQDIDFLTLLHWFFMIYTFVRRSRFQSVLGMDFRMASGIVLASILHILEVWIPKKSIPKQR